MADDKTMPPGRALVLNTLIAVLIACVVFSVGSWVLLVPAMAGQQGQIAGLRAEVSALSTALAEVTAAQAKAAAAAAATPPAPAAPPAPAGAPAAPVAPAAPAAPAPAAK